MLKLIKYEILKRQKLFLISLLILTLVEGFILFGIFKGSGWLALAIVLMLLLCYGSIIAVFVDTIRNYSADLNQKSGYSLFLTPTSGYKIIASKAIISFIELIIVVAAVFGLMYLNLHLIDVRYVKNMDQVIQDMIQAIKDSGFLPRLSEIIAMVLVFIFEWFNMIMVAVLAMTLRKTILSNSKVGWLISIIFFIAIYSVLSTISMTVMLPLGYFGDMANLAKLSPDQVPTRADFNILKYLIASLCLYPVYIGSTFFLSGKLLNKRVDL